MRRFQLTEEHFNNPCQSINIKLKCDILSFLFYGQNYTQEEIFRMGQFSYHTNKNSPLADNIRSESTISSTYQNIMENLANKYFDKNFIYKLTKCEKASCTISVEQNNDVAKELEAPILGSDLQRLNRAGVISSFSSYLGLPSSNLEEVPPKGEGKKTVRYRIHFPPSIH